MKLLRQKVCKQLIRSLGIVLSGICLIAEPLYSQIVPMAAQYYQNEYLGNPALAGMSENLIVNLDYRNQWRGIPGSPVSQAVTADYRIREKVGVGLNLYNDKAGLIGRTRLVGTYAYHLALDGEKKMINFGLSLGIMNESLDYDKLIADPNDISAENYNHRSVYLDGDFGIAYVNDRLALQGALPNLKKFLKKDISNSADGSTYFLSIAYKLGSDQETIRLEPKYCLRGARGLNNLWDIGTSIKFPSNLLSLLCMYHSSKSTTLGFELNYQSKVYFHGFYSNQLAAMREDTGGSFEIGFMIPFKIIKDVPANRGY